MVGIKSKLLVLLLFTDVTNTLPAYLRRLEEMTSKRHLIKPHIRGYDTQFVHGNSIDVLWKIYIFVNCYICYIFYSILFSRTRNRTITYAAILWVTILHCCNSCVRNEYGDLLLDSAHNFHQSEQVQSLSGSYIKEKQLLVFYLLQYHILFQICYISFFHPQKVHSHALM